VRPSVRFQVVRLRRIQAVRGGRIADVSCGDNAQGTEIHQDQTPEIPISRAYSGSGRSPAARSKNTYFFAKYHWIASRRGPMRAIVAVEHAMMIAAWNVLANGDYYRDPGGDCFTSANPRQDQGTGNRPTRSPRYRVILEPLTETA
jgi:transposase